jgi:hypothetical protein
MDLVQDHQDLLNKKLHDWHKKLSLFISQSIQSHGSQALHDQPSRMGIH